MMPDNLGQRTQAIPPGGPDAQPFKVISARRGHFLELLNFREILRYHELFYMFCWREFKARYKQTALGAMWAMLQPFFTMVVFSLLLGRIGGIETGDVPFPIYVFAGTLTWQIVQSGVMRGATSLVDQSQLIGKVYFPRIYLPIAPLTVALTDFALAFLVMLGLYGYYGIVPNFSILLLPVFLLLVVLAALSVVLWLCALNVDFRDVKHAVPFGVQAWMYLTPVVYPRKIIPADWRFLYDLNPMVAIIDGVRWCLIPGLEPPTLETVVAGALIILFLLVTGMIYFQQRVHTIVDKI